MSHISVMTWNAEGMFVQGTKTRRAGPHDALAVLKRLHADIVVVPEFGRLADLSDEVETTINALGYELVTMAYDEPRTPGLGFAIMSRLPISRTQVHALKGSARQLLEVVCHDDDGVRLRIFGAHLDDRSEAGRLTEVQGVVEIINHYDKDHVLLLGDMNAMHKDALFARFARSQFARGVTRHVSHVLVRSMADRVGEMALGTTIDYILQHTALRDLDPARKRTISSKQAGLEWAPAWRLAKIDWIFGSKAFKTIDYHVSPDVGSDHRPVIADLEY
jgi:endonuclease/exonuclease/phosphatase family metal-dependent hydrolase